MEKVSNPALSYPLHAIVLVRGVRGWEVQRGRGLSAGQGEVVLTVQLHVPHHLRFETPIKMAAVLQAPPPPSLGAVAVLTHAEPVRCAPEERWENSDS